MLKRTVLAIVYLSLAAAASGQTSTITAVLNNLGQPRLSPGEGATIYGSFPPDRKPSFTVTIGGIPAFINFVLIDVRLNHAISMGIQVPTELSPGNADVVVSDVNPSPPFSVTLSQFDPVLNADPFQVFVHLSGVAVTPSAPAAPGETITTFMTGLGATNPLVPTGTQPSTFTPTSSPVTVTVGGLSAQIVFAGRYALNAPFVALDYQLSFNVPASAPSGPNPVVVTIGGVNGNTQTLYTGTQAQPSPPVLSRVVNGANFSNSTLIAPGSFVTLFGTGFGSQDNLTAFPGTQVNGISVLFNGEPAPIFNLIGSVGQITVLSPSDLPTNGNVAVTVQNQNGPSKAVNVGVAAAGPAMFAVPDPAASSRHNVAALFANTAWYVMPASQAQALGFTSCAGLSVTSSCGQPAKRGDFVQLYATGLGAATPNGDPAGTPIGTGVAAPANGAPVYATVAVPVITVGGQPATVQFSGLAPGYAGLYQVNFQIPQNAPVGDNVPILLAMPGSSTDSATIAIQ